VNDLLAMYRDEALVENKNDDADENDEEEVKAPATKSKKNSTTQKSMQDYLRAAEQQRLDLNRNDGGSRTTVASRTTTSDLNPDNIFLMPTTKDKSSAASEQRAKARFDANQKRHNARIAAQVMRDAKDAGIDPRSIDRSMYENAALDSDLEDDDVDSDSIELSDSDSL
jgi:hypothetical protein